MKKLFITALFIGLMANPVWADSMRCGDKLVSTGYTTGEVMLICGEPFYKETTAVEEETASLSTGSTHKLDERVSEDIRSGSSASVKVVAEKWYYNLGKDKFVRILTFEGGALTKVEEGDKP
jgi:hypothetical protein